MVESGSESGKGRFRATIEKLSGRVSVIGKSMCVPENGRIRATFNKLLGRVSKKGRISVNTEKW